jgi:hexosaminidase
MWGMESFSQIVRFNFTTQAYSIASAPWRLHDAPRFPHRGLMIDLSRHFLPLASIRSIIDSIAYAKMNVLHLHISDEQSFPMEIRSYPKLWDAAYSDQERCGPIFHPPSPTFLGLLGNSGRLGHIVAR